MTPLAGLTLGSPESQISCPRSDFQDPLTRFVLLSLAGLLIMLPLFDGGRSFEARTFFIAFVSLLFGIVLLVGNHKLPVRGYLLAGLFLLAASVRSVYFDLSLQASLLFLAYFLTFSLASVFRSERSRMIILYSLTLSGLLATATAFVTHLLASPGSLEAGALRGTFHYPNGLAGFLLVTFYPSAAMFLHAEGKKAWLLALASSVLLLAILLTRSRGGWLAFLLLFLLWAGQERALLIRKWRRVAAVGLVLLALAWVSAQEVGVSRYAQHAATMASGMTADVTDPSFYYRRHIYAWTFQIFLDHPLLGTGPGTFPLMLGRYQKIPYVSGLYAHNHYLQTAAEMGLFGLLLLLTLLGWLFWRGFKIVSRLSPLTVERSIAVSLLAALLASAVHAGFDFDWSYPAIAVAVVLEAALLMSYNHPPISDSGLKTTVAPHWMRVLGVALLLCMVLLAFARFYGGASLRSGKRALQEGRVSKAEEAFQRAARIYPLSYAAHYWLAVVYAEQVKPEEALAEADTAFRLNPEDGDAHYDLGKMYWHVGRLGEAEQALARAVRLEPASNLKFYADLGGIFLASGRREEAHHIYQRAVQIFTPDLVLTENARCLAPGDRYLLGSIFEKISQTRDHTLLISAPEREKVVEDLRRPDRRGICRDGLNVGFTSPEATILTHWRAAREGRVNLLLSTYAEDLRQRLSSHPVNLPSWVQDASVSRIVEMSAGETKASVVYEVTAGGRTLRFRDRLKLAGDGWRLVQRRR